MPTLQKHIQYIYTSNPNVLLRLVTIATDRVAKVPASESRGGCQGDGAASIPCIHHFGKISKCVR